MDRLISGLSWFLVAFLLIAMAAFAYAAFTVFSVTDFRQTAAEQRPLLRTHAETVLAAAAGDRAAMMALKPEAQRIESGFEALADSVPLLSKPELTSTLQALRAEWSALAPRREQLIGAAPMLEPVGALSGQLAVLARMESLADGLRSARGANDSAGAAAASRLQIALTRLRLALTEARR